MPLNVQIIEPTYIYNFLEKIVNINSYTHNLTGIEKVANCIINEAKNYGFNFEKIYPSNDSSRFHLILNKNLKNNFYGIVGHIDTVHPSESVFNKLTSKDDKLIGPGVNDMKGGVVVALFSMFILKKLGNCPDFKVIFNTDEEIGSKTSKEIIKNEMKNAKGVFVFEAGRLPGNKIIAERKGVMELVVEVFGKNAHAGEKPHEGINAIVELSDKILKLHNISGTVDGLTIEPGIISGGTARNVIPDYAKAVIDVRFKKNDHKKIIKEKIENILKQCYLDKSQIKFNLNAHRMPLELNEGSKFLIEKYISTAKSLGYTVTTTTSGGVSDANILNKIAPVIDGLGPVGGLCHTKDEFIIKDSLIDRIKIFTAFIKNLQGGGA